MTWTTRKPAVPGWYWWRFNNGVPRVTELIVRYGKLYVEQQKNFVDSYVDQCEWSSAAIEPPEDARGAI